MGDEEKHSPRENRKNIPKIQTASGTFSSFKPISRVMAMGRMQVRYAAQEV
jgi:hypothetical protein